MRGRPSTAVARAGAYYHCSGRLTHAREPRCNLRGVQAAAAEAHVLLSLAVMSSDQDVLAQAADDLTRLASTESKVLPKRDSKKIEEQIRRLGRLYEARLKTDAEFETELAALHTQLAATQTTGTERVLDIHQATKVLNDVPKLIAQATDQERRALLVEVFDDIYLTPHQAMAVRPAAAYAGILKALDQSSAFNQMFVWWAGWVSGRNCKHTPPDPDIRGAASESRLGKRRWITNLLSGYACTHSHGKTLAFL
jgi:hypothetical protein